jgi:hypothetical protein
MPYTIHIGEFCISLNVVPKSTEINQENDEPIRKNTMIPKMTEIKFLNIWFI